MTSYERLTNLTTRSSETLVDESSSDGIRMPDRRRARTDEDDVYQDQKGRNRLSIGSMPGSISGSQADFEFDEEDEEDLESEYGSRDGEEGDEYDGQIEDPEEAAEEGFDDDLLATGEMESVPFL